MEIQGLSRVNFAILAGLIRQPYFSYSILTHQKDKLKKIKLGVIYILKICYNAMVAVGEPCIINELGGLQNG